MPTDPTKNHVGIPDGKNGGQPPVRSNTPPLQTSIVPRVVMKEGMAKVMVINPFIYPIPIPKRREMINESGKDIPFSIRDAKIMGQKQKTDPNERSISPDTKSIVTPSATIPSSGIISKITPMFSLLKKRGEMIKKTRITTKTMMKLLISRRIRIRFTRFKILFCIPTTLGINKTGDFASRFVKCA